VDVESAVVFADSASVPAFNGDAGVPVDADEAPSCVEETEPAAELLVVLLAFASASAANADALQTTILEKAMTVTQAQMLTRMETLFEELCANAKRS
jgi:hypothetical protein